MPVLPEPPAAPALSWRPWTVDDAEALARHVLRIHQAERLEQVGGADTFRWLASQVGLDPATDTLIGIDDDGEIQAEVGTWHHLTDAGARVFLWIDTDPGYETLRPFLLAWGEARARQSLDTVPPGIDRVIRIGIEEHRHAARSAIEAAGFTAARSFAVMRRPLTDLPPLPDTPKGIVVTTWSAAIDEAMRETSNEAFADHWGSLPMTPEGWRAMTADAPSFRADASFAAMAGEIAAAFCTVEFDPEDAETRGYREFYLHRVGTRRDHRRRGLASLVIIHALHAAAAAGADTMALEVDETSHTNATVVYERLGFTVAERSIHYLKTE